MSHGELAYRFYVPAISLAGPGSAKETGYQAKSLGASKALIVTDQFFAGLGVADKIKTELEACGLRAVIFDGSESNPTDVNVEEGVRMYRVHGCDAIISLGGGGSHDCAKGIGLVIGNGGEIRDFEGVNKSTKPTPPFVAINTGVGAASEMTSFCIITNTDTHMKMAIVDWHCTPNVAINDPQLNGGEAAGGDALSHLGEEILKLRARVRHELGRSAPHEQLPDLFKVDPAPVEGAKSHDENQKRWFRDC